MPVKHGVMIKPIPEDEFHLFLIIRLWRLYSQYIKTLAAFVQHLRRFLRHTFLKALQWINFTHDKIVFTTIKTDF